jgi:hypothetical protein
MIHEAACCGSIQCLTLLLELGAKLGATDGDEDVNAKIPSRPRSASARNVDLPFLPRRIDRGETFASLQMYAQQSGLFTNKKARAAKDDDTTGFLSILRVFRECSAMVKKGTMSELDAARKVLEHATLPDTSVASLTRSCTFNDETNIPRSILSRSQGGTSDGHGNTPLHWAAFKNETECVSLLLKFGADANARAHPSGWTPLHDAASVTRKNRLNSCSMPGHKSTPAPTVEQRRSVLRHKKTQREPLLFSWSAVPIYRLAVRAGCSVMTEQLLLLSHKESTRTVVLVATSFICNNITRSRPAFFAPFSK